MIEKHGIEILLIEGNCIGDMLNLELFSDPRIDPKDISLPALIDHLHAHFVFGQRCLREIPRRSARVQPMCGDSAQHGQHQDDKGLNDNSHPHLSSGFRSLDEGFL